MRFWATILAVYFLLLSLAPNWQGLEFFKTDALLSHYAAYQKEAKDPSFIAFIQEHYIQQFSEPHTEHRELPFKSCSQQTVHYYYQELLPIKSTVAVLSIENNAERNHVAPQNLVVNDYFHFWHPPQL
jgi:hypothetical protein